MVIVFNYKADEDFTVRILGKFRHAELSSDASTNFWTVNHPHLLALVGAYIFETRLQNLQRQQAYLASIHDEIRRIEIEDIQNSLAGFNDLRLEI